MTGGGELRAGTGACPYNVALLCIMWPTQVTGDGDFRAGTGTSEIRAGTGACPYNVGLFCIAWPTGGTGDGEFRAGTGACPYVIGLL